MFVFQLGFVIESGLRGFTNLIFANVFVSSASVNTAEPFPS